MSLKVGPAKYGGSCVTGSAIDLPFVLPGELVELDPLTILKPSLDRVPPACIHFGVCGGCHYQHAAYPAQLQLKSAILQGIFADALLPESLAPVLHAAEPWHYRNRIRLRVEQVEGVTRFGYSRRNTNAFLPIRMCPIAAPILWRSAETLLEMAHTDPLCALWLEHLTEVELFTSPDESRLQLTFFLRAPFPGVPSLQIPGGSNQKPRNHAPDKDFATLCEHLKTAIPELIGAGALMDPELSRRDRRSWPGATWGADGLACSVAGFKHWVSRGAFFQVNRFLVDTLVELAVSKRSGPLAWDLYAGVGLFSRPLAQRFERVVAVEGSAVAAQILAQHQNSSLQAVHSPTLDFLRAAVLQRDRPALVVLDPPRAGLGHEASALLARIAPAEIVYVSCDPITLARDLAVLMSTGYRAGAVHLIDLFPQTFHIETVVHLRKI